MNLRFYERYEELCKERGLKPQSQEILAVSKVTSPSVSEWKKKGSIPRIVVLCKLAEFFDCSLEYILGLSELRNYHSSGSAVDSTVKHNNGFLSSSEEKLLQNFRMLNEKGQTYVLQNAEVAVLLYGEQQKGKKKVI